MRTQLVTGLPPLLLLFMIAAFCVGAGVFYRVGMRRRSHVAMISWGVAGALVMAIGWGAYAVQAPPVAALFTGLILPIWLFGGLFGMIVGLARQALQK